MNPRKISVKVTYDNKDISESLAPYLKSLSYTDNLSGEADDLSLKLEDKEGLWQSDWMPDMGAELTVTLTSEAWGSLFEEERTLRLGLFEIDEIESSGSPSEVSLKAVSVPDANALRGVNRTRSWEEVEFKVIAQDIADGAGMELVYDSEENPKLDRAEQTEQSDLSFLTKLCNDQGFALKISEKQIIIFDEAKYESVAPKIAIVNPGALYMEEKDMLYLTWVEGWRFRKKVRDIYKACHVAYQNSDTKEMIEGTFTAPDKKEGKTLEVKEEVGSTAEAEKLAKKKLREKNREEITGSFDLPGNFNLLASTTVKIIGFGEFDGNYIIETANHDVGGGYKTSIDIRRCLDGY